MTPLLVNMGFFGPVRIADLSTATLTTRKVGIQYFLWSFMQLLDVCNLDTA